MNKLYPYCYDFYLSIKCNKKESIRSTIEEQNFKYISRTENIPDDDIKQQSTTVYF